jgi:hypothetical protein
VAAAFLADAALVAAANVEDDPLAALCNFLKRILMYLMV